MVTGVALLKGDTTPSSDLLAEAIAVDLSGLQVPNTDSARSVRRVYSRALKPFPAEFVYETANRLVEFPGCHWIAYELVRFHPPAFRCLDVERLDRLSHGISGWDTVDAFARILSGPAWLHGMVDDGVIERWARDRNVWKRRQALVSTVALNMRSQGGTGDPTRTLAVCALLVDDHSDTIEKALSWAIRELIVHDRNAVIGFLDSHESQLGARVKREVSNKLRTGLKNPRGHTNPALRQLD